MANRLSGPLLRDYFVSIGAKPYEAAVLAGNAGAESSYNPYLSHDKGTGYGLWGHRNERWDAMQRFTGQRTPDWQAQAQFALNEWRSRPESKMINENSSPQQLARAGMFFERPVGFTPQNPEGGHNFSGRLNNIRGLLGSASGMDTSPGNMAPQGFTPNPSPSAPDLPSLVGSPMPDTSGGSVGDPMASQQQPDYMAQMGKMMGGFGGGGGGGGGEAPLRPDEFNHFALTGRPKELAMQALNAQTPGPVQMVPYGGQKMPMRRRGLLG